MLGITYSNIGFILENESEVTPSSVLRTINSFGRHVAFK